MDDTTVIMEDESEIWQKETIIPQNNKMSEVN
jgi:hypothetical protein